VSEVALELNSDLSARVDYNFGELPLCIKVLDMYKLNYQIPSHWHTELEFVLVISGELTVVVAAQSVTLRQGEAIAINSGRLHRLLAPVGSDCRIAVVVVDPALLLHASAKQQALMAQRLAPSSRDYLRLDGHSTWQDGVRKRISILANYFRFGGADDLTAYAEALTMCARTLPHFAGETPAVSQLLAVMLDFVELNYAQPITTEDIARSAQLGRSRCFAVFAAGGYPPPATYLTQRRVQAACKMLRDSDMTSAEISQRCGFASPSYFARVFKQEMSMTPLHYRQRQTV
jgi:AraC-like DNA-binding protein